MKTHLILAAGLVLLPAPAMAGHKHDKHCGHHRSYEHGHDVDYDGHGYRRHDRFVVPEQIVFEEIERYQPYYERRIYYAPHRHHHLVYTFPVHTHYGAAYRPVSYCRAPSGFVAFEGRRFGFRIGF